MSPQKTLSKLTLTAALLMGLTVLVHILLGGPEVHDALLASEINVGLKAMSSVLWHAVTVVLIVFTGALFHLARHSNPAMESAVSTIQLGMAGLFLWYGVTMLGTIWLLPQWTVFTLIPALTYFGQRGR